MIFFNDRIYHTCVCRQKQTFRSRGVKVLEISRRFLNKNEKRQKGNTILCLFEIVFTIIYETYLNIAINIDISLTHRPRYQKQFHYSNDNFDIPLIL